MFVEIFYPPENVFCLFEPAFDVPYRLVRSVKAPTISVEEALAWTRRHANVNANDPWIRTGLRSAMVGDVFLVKRQAYAVMPVGYERFEYQRDGGTLTLRRGLTRRFLPLGEN